MKDVLYPYRVPDGDLQITITAAAGIVDAEAYTIDLRDHEGRRQQVRLELEVATPHAELAELKYSGLHVVVTGRCGLTDVRQAAVLNRSPLDSALWSGSMDLDRRMLKGQIALKATLTGTVEDVACRHLAESEEWTVLLDDAAGSPLRGTLPVKWMDFGEREDLRPYVDQPFFVDMETPVPTVFLNKRIDGLPEVLPKEGLPPGPARPMFETLRTSIARSVWLALFEASLAGITVPAGSDDEEPGWPQVPWQQQVLRMVLPRVYTEASDTEALRLAVEARVDEDRMRRLVSKALLVIEKDIIRDGTVLRRALKAMSDSMLQEA